MQMATEIPHELCRSHVTWQPNTKCSHQASFLAVMANSPPKINSASTFLGNGDLSRAGGDVCEEKPGVGRLPIRHPQACPTPGRSIPRQGDATL